MQYVGRRVEGQGCMVIVVGSRGERALDPRIDLRNHSPSGYEWGYAGSGPAQLALALLADALHDDALAVKLYQRFKFRHVVNFPRDGWAMSLEEVRAAARAIVEEKSF